MLQITEVKEMKVCDLPLYHQAGAKKGCTHVLFGEVKESSNQNMYVCEKKCQNKVCRVLCPRNSSDKVTVILPSGIVATVYLTNFNDVSILKIIA